MDTIMSPSLVRSKPQATRQKRRSSANVASAKAFSKKAVHKRGRALRELAKEFAKKRAAGDNRALTPLQRRMMSGGP
jgi:hypothetical protein